MRSNLVKNDFFKWTHYIIPLKIGNSGIDYNPASFEYLCECGETFRYNYNTFFVYTNELDNNHNVTLCVDTNERGVKTRIFREKICESMSSEYKYENEMYTWDRFKELSSQMGTSF